jgi:hypothetical protein
MMLSWISDDPPSIDDARERSQSRVMASSSAAKSSPLQPSPAKPRMPS